jgi:hypothetical protein
MSEVRIACIVEGYGDVKAVPILVRRIVREIDPTLTLKIPDPAIRVSRSSIVKPGELERFVQLAALKLELPGGILVLMDADQDCPAQLGPDLLARARAVRRDVPISVVLAKPEFETWFLAAATSLRDHQGLSQTMLPPDDPEEISGAKEWLRKQMPDNRKYSETIDQIELTRYFDLNAARQTPSFDKLCRDIAFLVEQLRTVPGSN